ncbi:hypothetical protein LTR35_009213 [Friedmanniomyces endolithicus]|uniref:Uncharacterized protein n=1 Tax=Friedmanniomyces endolithicus TaxID=329885 RepID=A0AAN6J7K3_9PEZI|nr:hypothetical protein LTR35_009213 [Friedmanniomyces endolithicus]KAK0292273.1 hypothetical protein LTS00_008108 [Friedmanniomyces endolithicus]KAK0320268.1 hypothetical protein LTR82_008785 [Friedmanniomyces endolithicus]KAK0993647.1 hypothetical protein LTR54_010939 [Friedmanniomyces endolithicus]
MAFGPFILPMDDTMPAYFIYRDSPPGQAYDPAAPPVYFPPKDSDELFDALRLAFPHVKSHTERMRDAMIKFLLEERHAEQLRDSTTIFPDTTSTAPSPWLQSWPSISSTGSTSTFSSPETMDLVTPTFGMSPLPHVPQLTRQYSTAPSITATSSGESSPPALEGMTGVFSVSTNDQPKQRIRRKMTEAEKAEYRKRRIVKACDKCATRKRKCNHNQPEMETVATTKQRVTKSPPTAKSAATLSPQKVKQALTAFDNLAFDDSFGTDMPLFDDFSDILQNQMMDFELDHMNEPYQHMATSIHDVTAGRNLQPAVSANSANSANSSGVTRLGEIQAQPGRLWAGEDPQCLSTTGSYGQPQGSLQSGQPRGSGNRLVWEHLRTGQSSRKHALLTHDTEGRLSQVFDSFGPNATDSFAGTGRHLSQPSLSSVVLRLTGATKAIRTFGRLLKSNGPKRISLQLISLTTVAEGLVKVYAPRNIAPNMSSKAALSQARTGSTADIDATTLFDDKARSFRRRQQKSDIICWGDPKDCQPEFLPNPDPISRNTRFDHLGDTWPLEGMSIGDYLRMKTNIDDIDHQMGRGGQALPSCVVIAAKQRWSTPASTASEGLASTSVPAPTGPLLDNSRDPNAPQGRPAFAFGEGTATATSPSTEMYMLRRRIPKALHSIVDRANRTAPTPLLQSRTSPANGGAYPRLDTTSYVGPADSATAGYAGRPDSATASNGGEGRQDTAARYVSSPIRATASNRDQGRQAHTPPSLLGSDGSSSSVCDVYVHKKRSTFRNKDHFGPWATTSAGNWESADSGSQLLRAAVLAVLLLAFFLLTSRSAHDIHATVLLVLSLMAVPCEDGNGEDEEATSSRKAFSWHDAMWPGTSGVGVGRRLRRVLGFGGCEAGDCFLRVDC